MFLVMPISWKGTLQQYAGRLHRLYAGKKDVQIYDYVDIRVKMLEKMYHKRLHGYATIGYQPKGCMKEDGNLHMIYDKRTFFPVYRQDICWAKRSVLIVSPFITQKRVLELLHVLREALERKVHVTVITRPAEDFTAKLREAIETNFQFMKQAGVQLVFKRKIHQKFAVIDQKIVWYGSINLLSFGYSEESIMRMISPTIATELKGSLGE